LSYLNCFVVVLSQYLILGPTKVVGKRGSQTKNEFGSADLDVVPQRAPHTTVYIKEHLCSFISSALWDVVVGRLL